MSEGLFALAVIPAIVVIVYVYKMDKVEKEPIGLLVKTFIFGMISCIPAVILELLSEYLLDYIAIRMLSLFIEYFFFVGLSEEFSKRLMTKAAVWKSPHFNYAFDGIVYCVVGSMGFAAFENIFYVIDSGLDTALLRAVTAIPGHAVFGVYMGYYFGRAKYYEKIGNKEAYKMEWLKSLWIPVVIHGFYDFAISADSVLLVLIWLAFIVIMDVRAIKLIKNCSKFDYAFEAGSGVIGEAGMPEVSVKKDIPAGPVYTFFEDDNPTDYILNKYDEINAEKPKDMDTDW